VNVLSSSLLAKVLLASALAIGPVLESHAYSFSDNFDNGVIDTTFWGTTGDGISESGGTLNLSRNNAGDSISSLATFSGHFDLSFDIRLDNIVWNDCFHGISLIDTAGSGISFGFSRSNGKFFSAESTGSSTSWYYDAASFTPGTSYSVRLVGDTGGTVLIYVNDTLMFTRDFSDNFTFSIQLPGDYWDGDGPGIGDSNTTNSHVDNFVLNVQPLVPANVPTLSAWGTFGLGVMLALGAVAALRRRRPT
jgi:hypothetical protein